MSPRRSSSSSEESVKREVVLTAKWKPSAMNVGEKVRMSWHVRNNTGDVVIIEGYCILFWYNDIELGMYRGPGKWVDKKEYISSRHVTSMLWPDEIRTFEWADVPSDYYGIDKPGAWKYQVILKTSREATGVSTPVESNQAILNVAAPPRRRMEADLFRLLEKDIPTLISGVKDVQSRVRVGGGGIIDFLLFTDKEIIVVEVANRIVQGDLYHIRRHIDWAKQAYQWRGLTILGAVVGYSMKKSLLDKGNVPADVRLYLAEDGEIRAV